jgi:hypothetical protein
LAVGVGLVVAGLRAGSVLIVTIGVLVCLGGCTIGSYADNWAWTGIGPAAGERKGESEDRLHGKTLWDLLQLLIVPLALAGLGFWITAQQHASDQKIADNKAKDSVLDGYLSHMSDLLVSGALLGAKNPTSSVLAVARARTVTALRRLDSGRNRLLTQFLADSGLLSVIDLSSVDLSYTQLNGAYLTGAELSNDLLGNAALERADLRHADLFFAHAAHADMSGAHLQNATLRGMDLRASDLRGANLFGATLIRADLSGAKTDGASVTGVKWGRTICPDGSNSDRNRASGKTCVGHGFSG